MLKKRLSLGIVLPASLSACYPMEQASLVYSSSNNIGVSVVAGTPDTPGLVLNVGYRGLNAAYVPVAVARHCPQQSAVECDRISYQLQQLKGNSDRGSVSSSDQGLIEALRQAVAAQEVRIANLTQSVETDRRRLNDNRARIARRSELAAERAAIDGRAASQVSSTAVTEAATEMTARRAQIEAELGAIAALEDPNVIEGRISRDSAELDRVSGNLQSDRNRLDALTRARNARQADNINDAYSVFGSFDGNASGSAESATISAGQIFSTGVAAQHLTRGLGESAVATACMRAVADIAATFTVAAERAGFVRDAIEICRRRGATAQADAG